MTSALSGKGITFPAYGERRTPSLCKGLSPWVAVRAHDLQASTRSPSPNTARRQGGQHAHGQSLRLGSKPLASFGRGAPRCPRALQGAARLGLVAEPRRIFPVSRMRYNSAAHADARASGVLCNAHRARAGGCGRWAA
jgi:hypothetical protein